MKEVTATFALESDHINYITIEDENGHTQTLEVTDVHPFWVVTDDPDLERAARAVVDENGVTLYHHNIDPTENGFWVEAKDLREGDVFLGANGELSTVVSVERVEFPDGIAVYNLTVDGNHNYFVIATCDELGQTSILVHNAGYGGPASGPFDLFTFGSDRFDLSVRPKVHFSKIDLDWKDFENRLLNKPFFREVPRIAKEIKEEVRNVRVTSAGIDLGAKINSGPLSGFGLDAGVQVPVGPDKPEAKFEFFFRRRF